MDCAGGWRVGQCLFDCSRSDLNEDCARRQEMWENVDGIGAVRVASGVYALLENGWPSVSLLSQLSLGR